MKLHLPSGLRAALFACFASFAGLSTTLSTATVAGGVFAVTMAGQAQAADYSEDATIAESLGSEDVNITGGTVTVSYSTDTGVGFTTGSVQVGSGAALRLEGNDAVGWSDTTTRLISLTGEPGATEDDMSGYATLDVAVHETWNVELALNGYTRVIGKGDINPYGSSAKITASGTYNFVSAWLKYRGAMAVEVVGKGDSLVMTGEISQGQWAEGTAITKTGQGKLTLDNSASSATQSLVGANSQPGLNLQGGGIINVGTLEIAGLTMAEGTTFANSGALTLSGTIALAGNSVIEMGVDSSLTASGLTIDVSQMWSTQEGDKTVYTLLTGEGNFDLSSLGLTAENIIGLEHGARSWTFGKGTISYVDGQHLTFSGSSMNWGGAGGDTFDGGATYAAGADVAFSGTASTVTLTDNVSATTLKVTEGAGVSINAGDGAYSLSAYDLENSGTLTLAAATTVTNTLTNDGELVVGADTTVNHYDVAGTGAIKVATGSALTITDTTPFVTGGDPCNLWTLLTTADSPTADYNGLVIVGSEAAAGNTTFSADYGYSLNESRPQIVKGHYKLFGNMIANRGANDTTSTIGGTGLLYITGSGRFLSNQHIVLEAGGAMTVDGTLELGHTAGYNGSVENNGGTLTVGTLKFNHSGEGCKLVLTNGGRVNVGSGGLIKHSGDPTITLTAGTLGATADWATALNMNIGVVTIDTTKQLIAADGTTSAGADGASITLNGRLTVDAAGHLTVAGNGTLGLGGTLETPSALVLGADVALTLSPSLQIDVSKLQADANGVYTLLTSATGDTTQSNLNLESLTKNNIIGDESLASGAWEFYANGTFRFVAGEMTVWGDGDLTWKDGTVFNNGAVYNDGDAVTFEGTATVTLGADLAPSDVIVAESGAVTIAGGEGSHTLDVGTITNNGSLLIDADVTVRAYDESGTGALSVAAGKTLTITDVSPYLDGASLWKLFSIADASSAGTIVLAGNVSGDGNYARDSYVINGGYKIEGSVIFNRSANATASSISSTGRLYVTKDLNIGTLQTWTVNGTLATGGILALGHNGGGEGHYGTIIVDGGKLAANNLHFYSSASSVTLTNGGRLDVGAEGITAGNEKAPTLNLTNGTLGALDSWTATYGMSIGNVTIDTTKQVVAADGTVSAGETPTGVTILLNGALTTTDTSSLAVTGVGSVVLNAADGLALAGGLDVSTDATLTNNKALTLGGTVKLGSAIVMGADASLNLMENTKLDLSAMAADGRTYTLLTDGAGNTAANLDLSSLENLAGLEITGADAVGDLEWTFHNNGKISYTIAGLVSWKGGDVAAWTPETSFDDDKVCGGEGYLSFSAPDTAADPAATGISNLTLASDITVGTVEIAKGAEVTLSRAEDSTYRLSSANGIYLSGELAVTADVLADTTKLVAKGDGASFVVDGIAVDYTAQLTGYTGAVTVTGAGGRLALSEALSFGSLTVADGAVLDLAKTGTTFNEGGTLALNGGEVMLKWNNLAGTVVLSGEGGTISCSTADRDGELRAAVEGSGLLTIDGSTASLGLSGASIEHEGNLSLKGNVNIGKNSASTLGNTGNITVEAGATARLNNSSAMSNTGDVIINGTLDVNSGSTLDNGGLVSVAGVLNLNDGSIFSNGKLKIEGGTVNANGEELALSSLSLDGGALNIKSVITGSENFALSIANDGRINLTSEALQGWDETCKVESYTDNDRQNGFLSTVYTLVTGAANATGIEGAQVYVDGKGYYLTPGEDTVTFAVSSSLDYYVTTDTVDYLTAGDAGAASIVLKGGTLAIAAADTDIVPIRVAVASQLSLEKDAALEAGKVTIASGATLGLVGAGTYTVTDAAQLTGLSATATGWTGTVCLSGIALANTNLNDYSNAGSFIKFNGATGYLSEGDVNAQTYVANIILTGTNADGTGDALVFNNGYNGDHRTFAGTVSGTGDIVRRANESVTAGSNQYYAFSGDVSGWSGSFIHDHGETSSSHTYVTFSGAATEINAGLNGAKGNTLQVTVSNDAAVAINGTITGNVSLTLEGTGTKTLSGTNTYSGGTTIVAGTLVAKGNSALGSGPATVQGGTLQLGSAVTELAGGISVADGAELYLDGSKLTDTTAITNNGTVRMGDGASIAGLTSGSLKVETGASVTSTADMKLASLDNAGALDLGTHNLELTAVSAAGGDVTAGKVTTAGDTTFGSLSVTSLKLGGALQATQLADTLTHIELTQPLEAGAPAVVHVGSYTGSALTFALTSDLLPAAVPESTSGPTYTPLLEVDSALADNLVLTLDVAGSTGTTYQEGVTLYTLMVQGNNIVLEASFNGTEWQPAGSSGVWSQDSSDEFGGDASAAMPADANIAFNGAGTVDGAGTIEVSGTVQSASISVDAPDTSYTFTGEGAVIATGSLNLVAGDVTLKGVSLGSADDGTGNGPLASVEIGGSLTVADGASLYTQDLTVNSANGLSVEDGGSVNVAGALVFADKSQAFTNAGKLSVGDGSDFGTVENLGTITATGGTVSIDQLTAGGTLEVKEDAKMSVSQVTAASLDSVSLGRGGTLEITDTATAPLMIGSLEGTGTISSTRGIELTSKTTASSSVIASSFSLQAGAAGSSLSSLQTGALTLVAHDGTNAIMSSTTTLLTADELSKIQLKKKAAGGIALTLVGLDATTVGDFGYGADGATDYIILTTNTAIAASDFTLMGTDGMSYEALQQAFALAENKAYASLEVRPIVDGAVTSYTLVLSVTKDEPRAWDSSNPDWAGNPGNNNDAGKLAGNVLDLAQIPGRYHDLDTVDVAYITNNALIDLTDEVRDVTDVDGLIIRHLSGTGDLDADAANTLTLKGGADDLATLSNETDAENGLGSSEFGGTLAIDGMQVHVVGDGATSLYIGTTSLAGANAALAVDSTADYRTGALTNTEAGKGTVSGTITVTGTGGSYDGNYGAGSAIVLAANAAQDLTIGAESGSANLALSAMAGSESKLSYTDGGATLRSLNTNGANITLDNACTNTLTVTEASCMEGGNLNLTVNAAEIAKGNTMTVARGLDFNGTTLWVSHEDAPAGATFDVSQGTKGWTLFTLTDGAADNVAVMLDATSPFFARYFVEGSARVEDGVVVADLVTDYYTGELARTENGTAGMQMLDMAVLQTNPQDGDLGDVLKSLDSFKNPATRDAAAADKLAAAVAGSGIASLGMALSGDVERQLKAIRNRTTTMGVDPNVVNEDMPYFNAWINAEGDYRSMDDGGTLASYTVNSYGGTVGFDMDVTPELTWGLALTAMYGDFESTTVDKVDGDMDTYYVSAFARATHGAWTHTFVATLGISRSELSRTVSHNSGSYTAEGDADGISFGVLYEVARTYALNEDATACWQPVFNVAYRHISVDGYEETGSEAALRVGDQSLDTVTFGLGARLQAVAGENIYNRTSIFEARALVKFDAGDRESEVENSLLNLPSYTAKVKSAEMDAVGLEVGVGLTVPVGFDAGSIFVDGSLEFRGSYTNFNAAAGYRVNF